MWSVSEQVTGSLRVRVVRTPHGVETLQPRRIVVVAGTGRFGLCAASAAPSPFHVLRLPSSPSVSRIQFMVGTSR